MRADLLDPAEVASLGDLEIASRWIVDGFLNGLHRSPRRGTSVEFTGHRAYQPGDEPRHIDWRLAARGDRLVVKEFEAETNFSALLVVDVSASMHWSGASTRVTKGDYARRCAAAIALLLLRQRDAVGAIAFADDVVDAVPPRARGSHWRRVLAALGQDPPPEARASRAAAALDHAGRMLRRSGLIVLISDLLSDDDVGGAVRAARARGHDVLVLQVMDPAERDLSPFTREALFVDPENGLAVAAVPDEVRAAYVATVERVVGEWRALCAAAGAEHAVMDTSQPFGAALRAAFARRERAA